MVFHGFFILHSAQPCLASHSCDATSSSRSKRSWDIQRRIAGEVNQNHGFSSAIFDYRRVMVYDAMEHPWTSGVSRHPSRLWAAPPMLLVLPLPRHRAKWHRSMALFSPTKPNQIRKFPQVDHRLGLESSGYTHVQYKNIYIYICIYICIYIYSYILYKYDIWCQNCQNRDINLYKNFETTATLHSPVLPSKDFPAARSPALRLWRSTCKASSRQGCEWCDWRNIWQQQNQPT